MLAEMDLCADDMDSTGSVSTCGFSGVRKRRSTCPDEYSHPPCSSEDNIRQKPDIVTYHNTPGVFKFRRRISTAPKIDYFSTYPVADHVLDNIFSYLNKRDTCSAMRTCKRLYEAGAASKTWSCVDLYNRTISVDGLFSILQRNCKVVRLAEATITPGHLYPGSVAWNSISVPRKDVYSFQLTHLDLGRASFPHNTSVNYIVKIIESCTKLQGLCLEGVEMDEENRMCRAIANNPQMLFLDLSMVRGLTPIGVREILKGCQRLEQVNLSWCSLSSAAVRVTCNGLPHTVTHLNLSGTLDKSSITNQDIIDLCEQCPNLVECDLSDNITIGDDSLEVLLHLEYLQSLSLNRCYGINPMHYLNCGHLEYLNVIGCITEDGELALRNGLPETQVNCRLFSYIAKPTAPPNVTSIWHQRTRDIY